MLFGAGKTCRACRIPTRFRTVSNSSSGMLFGVPGGRSFALSVGRVPAAIPRYPSRFLTTFRPRSPKTEVIRERTVKVACIQSFCGRWKVQNCIMLSA
jgi:hypothetical protein